MDAGLKGQPVDEDRRLPSAALTRRPSIGPVHLSPAAIRCSMSSGLTMRALDRHLTLLLGAGDERPRGSRRTALCGPSSSKKLEAPHTAGAFHVVGEDRVAEVGAMRVDGHSVGGQLALGGLDVGSPKADMVEPGPIRAVPRRSQGGLRSTRCSGAPRPRTRTASGPCGWRGADDGPQVTPSAEPSSSIAGARWRGGGGG